MNEKEVITCVKPLVRAETWEKYINKKGGVSYKAEFLERDFYDQIKENPKNWAYWNGNKYRRIDLIPCGKCIECQLAYARQWAVDCMLEKFYWPDNECWFLTITYDDEHLPTAQYETEDGKIYKGISLRKKDIQDFWKRLRKHYKCKCKYLVVGEYGSETQRPHYHAIVFGLPLDTKELKYFGCNTNGDSYWTNDELNKVWGKGNIICGYVTFKSISYVARYTIKKWKNKDTNMNKRMGRMPEFICMSQGIGYRYYKEYKEKLLEEDQVTTSNGQMPLPKRFMKQLREKDIELYTTLKTKHKKIAEMAEKERLSKTDLKPEDERKTREKRINNNFKDIRRKT